MARRKLSVPIILTSILLILLSSNVYSITEKWNHSMDGEVRWVYADDLDNDGEVEILVHAFKDIGFEKYSTISIFDKNGEIKERINTDAEIFDIQVMDFDRDGEKEIIAATGGLEDNKPENPYGSIKIYNKNGDEEQDYDIFGQFRSVYAADIDNDSRNEILAVSGYGIVTKIRQDCYCDVYLLNRRLELEWKFKAHEDRIFLEEYLDVYAEDLDNARDFNNELHKEIITSTNRAIIYVLDSNGTLRWNYSLDGNAYHVYAADLDNPEELREKTAYPCNITELNETEKVEEWTAICYACNITSCNETCNMSCREVVATSAAGTVYVFNSNGKLRWSQKTGGVIMDTIDTIISDLNGDYNKEIVVGSDEVYVLDNKGKLLWKYKTGKTVFSIYAADLSNDGIKEIIAGTNDGLYVLGAGGELYENYGALNVKSVYSEDIDNDNIREIIAGIGWYLYVFDTDETNLHVRSAEEHYKIAQSYLEKEDYNNALVYANKSYNSYVFAGDADGISKSNELILNIEKEVYIKLKETEAGKYLETAEFYYYNVSNQTNMTSCPEADESLVNVSPAACAKEYAKKAREIYLELGFEDMVNLTDPMIPEGEEEVNESVSVINETTNKTQETVKNETLIKPEEKGLIEQITSKELNFFGIPVLYFILAGLLILVIFILPIFMPEPKVMEPLNLVIVGAKWGEGANAHLLTSFLLGIRDADTDEFLEIGMVKTGLTDEQLTRMTKNLKPLITEETGREVIVKPFIVAEVAYEEIKESKSYTSGYELKFPHLVRILEDKAAEDADTIDRIKDIIEVPSEKVPSGKVPSGKVPSGKVPSGKK